MPLIQLQVQDRLGEAALVPLDLGKHAVSSAMLAFCEKQARMLITRAMAVSELQKIFD
jgi:hypothetical protein